MNKLVPEYQSKGYDVITRRNAQSISRLIYRKRYLSVGIEIFARVFGKIVFIVKCLGVFDGEIVFLHPQTAGYLLLFWLTLFNRVCVYVMDNSFFCIRSYNVHPLTRNECLECLGHIRPHYLCAPAPEWMPKFVNTLYLSLFQVLSLRLKFLAQNTLQSELLRLHFGRKVNVSVIGMNAENNVQQIEFPDSGRSYICNTFCYDIVFHGASNAAKGLFFVLEIADLLPELSFLIPDSLSNVVGITKNSPPSNVSCVEMTWETGLKEAVVSAHMVINPSMWSAPIEGALIKSAKFNSNVATVKSQYSYEAEIKCIRNHLRLSSDPRTASKVLREFFEDSR
ncbi:hypothetical protein SynPROS91_00193 [Synechococcus sp. PROS-9-1]|uniref:hypothetical protein n=1 Tax=Synechococcus sp. PROS-9-1 TaxID=1968775 RepID=UPI0016473B23|nr:hypothetical protein [Synechococcus sp. PROS-9-1]QNJ30621.1 hypothetical protein SynPROS91_00193 [Synechococcus sp. PROS-9-1]